MKQLNIKIFIAMAGILGLITHAQAKVVYGVSQQKTKQHILLGEKGGEPAIGLSSVPVIGDELYSASSVKNLATLDKNGVYDYKLENGSKYGIQNQYIDIVQLPNTDVYFGEWAQGAPDKSDKSHTVFYIGKDVTTNVPTSGTATYVVKGISQYNGDNLLNGNLNVNFDDRTLNGSISNSTLNIALDANINDQAGFSGKATANGSLNGTTEGHFYGDSAASLAGLAHFDSDTSKDTAFGGSKQ
ncbi:conserved exported protein of unknown function [Xenorhabdus poinarii G6]|uniref:Uncharacterized protein n=1 Tax=Xenorhabdus poinarii G6 TaxID=1354304 RepID=A0A068R7T8_9GAMM|nr:Slam-dependent surface lipoprotein [Xenorhabdus poinarii]CDG23322.1 conserved exported protein of unknown function [Xenorhabdus poinarii G6]